MQGTTSKGSYQTDNAKPVPFANLPTEIILEIFSLAVSSHSGLARNIALLSSWTLPIARKALYRTVVLSTSHQYSLFVRTLQYEALIASSGKYPELRRTTPTFERFFGKGHDMECRNLVSSIWLPRFDGGPNQIQQNFAVNVFAACIRLHRVAMPGFLLHFLYISRVRMARVITTRDKTMANITDLTLTPEAFGRWYELSETIPGRSFLGNLTHLWILDVATVTNLPLMFLTNLTHLAVPLPPAGPLHIVSDVSDDHKRLFAISDKYLSLGRIRMLVYHVPKKVLRSIDDYMGVKGIGSVEASGLAKMANSYDRRVFVIELEKDDARGLWESSARGGQSIWTCAPLTLGTS